MASSGLIAVRLRAPSPATRKPKTALTAARGFCKLRKSRSKVRFRSETKPERRRSAPGPENQIPIPIEHAHRSRRQLRL